MFALKNGSVAKVAGIAAATSLSVAGLVGISTAAQAATVDLTYNCGVYLADPAGDPAPDPLTTQPIVASVGTDIPASVAKDAALNANGEVTLHVPAGLAELMAGPAVGAAKFDASMVANFTVGGTATSFTDSVTGADVVATGFDVAAGGALGAVPTATAGAQNVDGGDLSIAIDLFQADGTTPAPGLAQHAWLECAAPTPAAVGSYTVTDGTPTTPVPTTPAPTTPAPTTPAPTTPTPTTPAPVVKAETATKIKVAPKKLKAGKKGKVKISVSGNATGTVKVVIKGKSVGKKIKATVTLKNGKGVVKLPKLKKGKFTVTANYGGSDAHLPSKAKKLTVTVK